MKNFFYYLIASLFFSQICYGQLTVGESSPNLVLSSTNNSILSFSFPYQNKVVLVYFWSSSVSRSKENIYKYKRLYTKYSDIGYKSCDGFDVISVALQSDKSAWEQDLRNFDLLKMNNCISTKGYNDFFVKGFKITQTPASFLIDEFGKIVFVNPSIKMIIDYLNDKRNSVLNADVQTKITGKIMFGNVPLAPLSGGKVWFLNEKRDTIQSVVLDDKGAFTLNNVNTTVPLTFYIFNTIKIPQDQPVFLTSENEEIVSKFATNELGFEYNLLDAEMPYLKSLFDKEVAVKIDKGTLKELYYSDILFKTKVSVLSKEAMDKLNTVVAKLKENPKTRVDVVSHTDSNGDTKLNEALSLKQSASISAYLVSKGIVKTRILTSGKGETEILNKCKDGVVCSEEDHNVNRRIEFKFYPLK